METKKISIVVPVYNVKAYIHRCIDSLINQTHRNLEIIIVDDGSTDGSGIVCDEYTFNDHRVKTIHKINGGVSAARQTGIDNATGDYVAFADPDDYIEPDMIALMLGKALMSGADVITCDFFNNSGIQSVYYQSDNDLLHRLIGNQVTLACWNTFFSRDFLVRHNIRFSPDWLSNSEDKLFNVRALVAGAHYAHIDKALYHYINRAGSIMNTRSRKSFASLLCVIDEIEMLVPTAEFDDLYAMKRYAFIYAYQGRYFSDVRNMYPEVRERIAENGNANYWSLDSQLARCMNQPPFIVWLIAKTHQYFKKITMQL